MTAWPSPFAFARSHLPNRGRFLISRTDWRGCCATLPIRGTIHCKKSKTKNMVLTNYIVISLCPSNCEQVHLGLTE